MHNIVGWEEIVAWLGDPLTTDAHFAEMLAWVPQLAEDPEGSATAVLHKPDWRGFIAHVPGTLAWVDYAVAKDPDTVGITNIVNYTEAALDHDPEPS